MLELFRPPKKLSFLVPDDCKILGSEVISGEFSNINRGGDLGLITS